MLGSLPLPGVAALLLNWLQIRHHRYFTGSVRDLRQHHRTPVLFQRNFSVFLLVSDSISQPVACADVDSPSDHV
jgi:hypothetical protein